MKTAKLFIRQMLSAASGQISSKRVMGVLIIVCILAVYIRSAVKGIECPAISGELLLTATALLGVDSVASAFRNNNNKNEQ